MLWAFSLALALPVVSTLVLLACQWLGEPVAHPKKWNCICYPSPSDVRIRRCQTPCCLHTLRLGSPHTAVILAWVQQALVESRLHVCWAPVMSIQLVCSIYTSHVSLNLCVSSLSLIRGSSHK